MTPAKEPKMISDGYSQTDRAKMVDDFRMIFTIEGRVFPHIENVFRSFGVEPDETGIFMDYYCSQILRLEKFGTIEGECALNLKNAGMLQLSSIKIATHPKSFVFVKPLPPLENDIARLKRRLKLMADNNEPDDCYQSDAEAFKDEQYMFTKDRLIDELENGMSARFQQRAAVN